MIPTTNRETIAMLAQRHHHMLRDKPYLIQTIQHSCVIPSNPKQTKSAYDGKCTTKILVTPNDTVTEIFTTPPDTPVAVLNFASYKNPGGQYLRGSIAQEEFLCHHSDLYEVLCAHAKTYYEPHKQTLNRGMYTDDAIWCEDITFFNYKSIDQIVSKSTTDIEQRKVGVLVMAAPNYKVAIDYQGIDITTYNQTLYNRLYRVLQNMYRCNPRGIIILGAYGCGVFRNDPKTVARYFKDIIDKYFNHAFVEIRFAVPHDNVDKYCIFKNMLLGGNNYESQN